jgi:nucleoside-diphosphate-sugar epimerase
VSQRVLITGAAGFVGRHFAADLAARGWWVLGVDVRPEPDGFPGVFVRADIRDVLPRDERAHDGGRFDLVVHAAAIVGGRTMIEGQPLKVATDLAIDSDLFQWALRTRPGRVLYFSSSAAYPIALQTGNVKAEPYFDGPVALHETMIDLRNVREPDQSYGWVKVTGEMLAGLARVEGVPVTVVRPFSGYGTDQGLEYPFPAIIDRVRRRETPVRVWGSGEQVRDWVHIDDVVAACDAIMASGTELPVNICTGRPTTFIDLAILAKRAAGYPKRPFVACDPTKPAGVMYRVGDPTRMLEHYRPRVTLEEGIERALRGER